MELITVFTPTYNRRKSLPRVFESLKRQTFRDLYEERTKLFEKYADITICEDGCRIEQTIETVLCEVGKVLN